LKSKFKNVRVTSYHKINNHTASEWPSYNYGGGFVQERLRYLVISVLEDCWSKIRMNQTNISLLIKFYPIQFVMTSKESKDGNHLCC